VIEQLHNDYDLTLYFFNPNIKPIDEYYRRLCEAERVANYFGVPILAGDYDTKSFDNAVASYADYPEGSERCAVCFNLRLGDTARKSADDNFDLFATTLTISPHKNSAVINRTAEETGVLHGAKPLLGDFKKKDGFKRSTELSRELGLYRQKYCGCRPTV
jgi:predicted adenine nucleotide alpha hydrolase (AANH) superfamily ATPase